MRSPNPHPSPNRVPVQAVVNANTGDCQQLNFPCNLSFPRLIDSGGAFPQCLENYSSGASSSLDTII